MTNVTKLNHDAEQAITDCLHACQKTRRELRQMLSRKDGEEFRQWARTKDHTLERIETFILQSLPQTPLNPEHRARYLHDCLESIECLADLGEAGA